MDQIDEYEQGEQVRAWLRNNGSSLIGGIALGLAALGGWHWWQNQQSGHQLEAAGEFHAYTKAVEANEETQAAAHLASLRQDYAKTPYVALAALQQATALHDQGKDDEAIKTLDTVSGEDVDPLLAELAQLRAARLLVGQGKHEDAIKRVDALADTAYPSVAAEIRGDAEMALGRREAARASYEKALASLDVAAPTRPMVEMKLTDAGGTPTAQPEI